jgi:hypothetical protein
LLAMKTRGITGASRTRPAPNWRRSGVNQSGAEEQAGGLGAIRFQPRWRQRPGAGPRRPWG